MPSLLQINTVVNSGSTGRIVEEIGLLAIAYGWKSYIAFGRNDRPSQSTLIKIGTDWDIKLHGLQTRLFDQHGLGSVAATKRLIEQIKAIKPDIIHLHNLHGYYLNIEILFNYLATLTIPIVWTLHDCWPFTGHCSHFDYIGCEKWKTQCYKCPQKSEYPASFGFDRSKKNYDLKKQLFTSVKNLTIVPVSNWLANLVKDSFLAKFPFQVIHNGINTSAFKPVDFSSVLEKYRIENKIILAGVASIWSSRKGLRDFMELAQRLNAIYQIVLVGLTEKQMRQLPQNIIGISRTENVQELAQIYSAADIFINPTWEDNFPTTNLEAMACCTPVISYKTGGSPESIDSNTGIIVKKGSIEELIEAINEIQKKGKEFYSPFCIKRIQQLYDKNNRYKDYINLYKSLISIEN